MPATFSVDQHNLYYSDGEHRLKLGVQWSGISKTEDFPCDFEIDAGDVTHWTEPAGEPITAERRKAFLAMDQVQI